MTTKTLFSFLLGCGVGGTAVILFLFTFGFFTQRVPAYFFVRTPTQTQAKPISVPEKEVDILLHAGGAIEYNHVTVGRPELDQLLSGLSANTWILVYADRNVPYDELHSILDVCHAANVDHVYFESPDTKTSLPNIPFPVPATSQ